MPISGLLLTLSADPAEATVATERIAEHPALLPGSASGRWLPVALEAEDDAGCRAVHDWLHAQPGVAFVDVVCVNFETDSPAAEAVAAPGAFVPSS